jgi:FixJ family two-component response regulator
MNLYPKIHIIDKNNSYRNVVAGMIRALGYELITTSDNYNFGENKLTGLDFVRTYRTLKFPNTRFVFLSSCTNIDVAVLSMQSGAIDYIIKSKSGLERLVRRLDTIISAYKVILRKQWQFRLAIITLGMFSIIFLLIIVLYNKLG